MSVQELILAFDEHIDHTQIFLSCYNECSKDYDSLGCDDIGGNIYMIEDCIRVYDCNTRCMNDVILMDTEIDFIDNDAYFPEEFEYPLL